jgi:hypothetical protein
VNKPSDSNQSLSQNLGFLTKIKYGGPLGKMTALGACLFITLCAIIFAARGNPYLLAGVLLIAFVSFVFLILQLREVFQSNPELATLEGREVIEYRKTELRFKHTGAVPVIEIVTDPDLPERPQAEIQSQAADDEEEE